MTILKQHIEALNAKNGKPEIQVATEAELAAERAFQVAQFIALARMRKTKSMRNAAKGGK